MEFKIFTDGGSFKNEHEESGYDGAAAFIIWEGEHKVAEDAIFLKGKTNNFSEMFAIGKAITVLTNYIKEFIEDKSNIKVVVITDSQLCQKSLLEWIYGWKANAVNGVLYNSKKEPVANQNLILVTRNEMDKLEELIQRKVFIQHINSHKSLKDLSKNCTKYNKKNGTNLSLEEYKFYHDCNDRCDKLVNEVYALNKQT